MLQERRGVRRHESLVFADADDQRGTVPRSDQHVRLIRGNDRNAVRPFHLAQRGGDRLLQAALVQFADEVRQDFGVGFRGEGMVSLEERLPDRTGVLDDAVVDERDPPGLVGVGMGVGRGGRAMRGPPGVADADGAGGEMSGDLLFEVGELASRLVHLEAGAVDDGDPGRVVSAVLHATQSIEQERRRLPWPNIPDNTAHNGTPSVQRRSALQASINDSASAAVGASAMNRMIGSVPEGRR